jgi:hypothetical protein
MLPGHHPYQVRFSQMQREEAHLAGRSTALHDQTEAMLSRIHVQGHVGAAGLQAESGQLRSKLAAANDDKRELQASLEREARDYPYP